MEALKAVVKNGRLILNEATDLPEGAEIELAVVHDHDDDAELLEEIGGVGCGRSRRQLGRL